MDGLFMRISALKPEFSWRGGDTVLFLRPDVQVDHLGAPSAFPTVTPVLLWRFVYGVTQEDARTHDAGTVKR